MNDKNSVFFLPIFTTMLPRHRKDISIILNTLADIIPLFSSCLEYLEEY